MKKQVLALSIHAMLHDLAAGRVQLASHNCPRCQGSGEDPEGYYDQSKGDAGHTHAGPCRECDGKGVKKA